MSVTGYVLAGGQSRRMGEPKSAMNFGGLTLLEIAVRKLETCCASVSILCGADEAVACGLAPAVLDEVPGSGPLGGISAALAGCAAEWALFLPVDVPLLPADAISSWIGLTETAGAVVSVLSSEGETHALPCLLHVSAGPAISAALRAGRLRVLGALSDAAAGPIQMKAVERLRSASTVPTQYWLSNVNTPQDLAAAMRVAGECGELQ